jgi:hypothetical protein
VRCSSSFSVFVSNVGTNLKFMHGIHTTEELDGPAVIALWRAIAELSNFDRSLNG